MGKESTFLCDFEGDMIKTAFLSNICLGVACGVTE